MNLTVAQIDHWTAAREPGTYLVQLAEGDTMPSRDIPPYGTIEGPVTVTLTVWRDGGWSAGPRTVWTPADIVR